MIGSVRVCSFLQGLVCLIRFKKVKFWREKKMLKLLRNVDPYELQAIPQWNPRKTAVIKAKKHGVISLILLDMYCKGFSAM